MDFLTRRKLHSIIPNARYIDEWYEAMLEQLPRADIDTIDRVSMFLAQTSHESGGYTRLSENLNYSWEGLRKVFRKYFKTEAQAKEYHRQPQRIAAKVYGGRMGNGPEASGDGWIYRGRGVIQITGRNNYVALAEYLDMTVYETIDFLETISGAVAGAVWYWDINNINRAADNQDIVASTKIINGGKNGLADREEEYHRIRRILES